MVDLQGPNRGPVMAQNGLIAANHYLAAQAGYEMLRKGGNAFDAALAAAAVLTVVEPQSSHVGGDLFALVYRPEDGRVQAINASGPAPAAATPDRFPNGIPNTGPLAVTVPGVVDGWLTIWERYCSRPLAEIFEPAIALAEEGFPVTVRLAAAIAANAGRLSRFPASARTFLPDGNPPEPGQILRQPDLAGTFRALADGGREAFYRGELGRRLVKAVAELGGILSGADLAAYRCEVLDPISVNYRGYTVFGQPPVSQGFILLECLKILEGFDLASYGFLSPDVIHLEIEAKKLAFEDRLKYAGDPKFVEFAVGHLLSEVHAESRRKLIRPDRAGPGQAPGQLSIGRETTYLAAVDRHGNAVSWIQSIFHVFGSAVVAGDTGILLNNRMCGFSPDPASPNRLEPGKRPVHTLNTYMVFKDGRPYLSGGTPGQHYQVMVNLQVLVNVLDFGLHPQAALDAPRWGNLEGTGVQIEARIPESTAAELRRRGHNVELVHPWFGPGRAMLIAIDPQRGIFQGAFDIRGEGYALGW
jgi:gamma-glutamyltranspeptidase/glutathione hydrolase